MDLKSIEAYFSLIELSHISFNNIESKILIIPRVRKAAIWDYRNKKPFIKPEHPRLCFNLENVKRNFGGITTGSESKLICIWIQP